MWKCFVIKLVPFLIEHWQSVKAIEMSGLGKHRAWIQQPLDKYPVPKNLSTSNLWIYDQAMSFLLLFTKPVCTRFFFYFVSSNHLVIFFMHFHTSLDSIPVFKTVQVWSGMSHVFGSLSLEDLVFSLSLYELLAFLFFTLQCVIFNYPLTRLGNLLRVLVVS